MKASLLVSETLLCRNMSSVVGLLLFLVSILGTSSACFCDSLSWVDCDNSSCECYISVGEGERQLFKCTTSIPICLLKKAEIYQLHHAASPESNVTSLADSHELYDPDCEPNGLFRPKQCNSTDVCWCVNGAGVRLSDNGDRSLQCEALLEANYVEMNHEHRDNPIQPSKVQTALTSAIKEQYNMDPKLVDAIKVKVHEEDAIKQECDMDNGYDVSARLITMDVRKNSIDQTQDLSGLAYYMEKDVKIKLISNGQIPFQPTVEGETLEIESILLYSVDEKEPTSTIENLTPWILIAAAGLLLAFVIGLLILFLIRRHQRYGYEKAQMSETEDI